MRDSDKTREQILDELRWLRARNAELEKFETEYKQAQLYLNERVKELQCLYGISDIFELPDATPSELYQKVVNTLPRGWRYPDITCARIIVHNRKFATRNWRNTKWKQISDINLCGAKTSTVEVCYLEVRPAAFEGPFRKEERQLIDAVAKQISRFTERRQTEEALKHTTMQLQNLMETAPVIIVRADLKTKVTYVNKKFEEILGYLPEEILGKSWVKLGALSKETTKLLLDRAVEKLAGGPPKPVEVQVKRKDGEQIWLSGVGEVVREGDKIVGFQVMAQDITERKRVEEALQRSEEYYRVLADNAADAIWTVDMNNRLTYASPSITRLLGYSVEEAKAKSMEEVFTPDSFKNAMKILKEEMAVEKKKGKDISRSRVVRLELYRKDGSIAQLEGNFSFIRGSNGQPAAILAIVRDISELSRAEERLRQLYEQEKKLRQELEAEIQKRIEFTRTLVHELKNPLTSVLASSELLAEQEPGEHWLTLVKNIQRSASNLSKRVDELFDLAKSDIGILQLNLKKVDVVKMCHIVADGIIPLALNKKQTLNLELPATLPYVMADEERLQQVLWNLLGNATKFTPEGGKITVSATKTATFIVVSVLDTGHGMTEEEQVYLFEPYSYSGEYGTRLHGLGLGLALSKKLIELHGGEIWVESQKNVGSKFSFSLPLEANKSRENVEAKEKRSRFLAANNQHTMFSFISL